MTMHAVEHKCRANYVKKDDEEGLVVLEEQMYFPLLPLVPTAPHRATGYEETLGWLHMLLADCTLMESQYPAISLEIFCHG